MMPASASTLTPVERVLDALRGHGRKVKQSGPNQWNVQCPCEQNHKRGDRNASAGVSESPAGAALINCRAGCTAPDMVAALGLTMRDLFPERDNVTSIDRTKPKHRYPYYDADGELLYEIWRYPTAPGESKRFVAMHPEGDRMVKGLGPGGKALYHWPQVRAAAAEGRLIVIVEGEKDAENAQWWPPFVEQRAVTTTKPFGAGHAYSPEMLDEMRGAPVLILADDDTPGRNHADQTATMLSGVAKSVTVMLPAEGFKDISEHIAAGKTHDDLRPIDGANDPPGDDEQKAYDASLLAQLIEWPDFWAEDHSAVNWIAEPIIPGGGRAIAIYAPAKSGKSLVCLDMAASVATGRPILGQPNSAGPQHVLYVDYEMSKADVQDRLTDMGYGPLSDLTHFHYALLPTLPPLDTKEGADALCRLAELVGAAWVVIDTMGRAVDGDENDADTIRNFYRHTGTRLKQAGRTYSRMDHAGKDVDKGQRGSSAKNDDVDVVWRLIPMEGAIQMKRTHTRVAWVPEIVILHRKDEPLTFEIRQGAYPDGTKSLAALMDDAGVPLDASYRRAREEYGIKGKNELIRAALKWRQAESTYRLQDLEPVDNPSKVRPAPPGRRQEAYERAQSGAQSEDTGTEQGKRSGAQPGAHPGAVGGADGVQTASLDAGAPSAGDAHELNEEDLF